MPSTSIQQKQWVDDVASLLKSSEELLKQASKRLATITAQPGDYSSPLHTNLLFITQQTDALARQHQQLAALLSDPHAEMLEKFPVDGVQLLQWQEEERVKTAKRLEDTDGQLLANAIFELAAVKSLIMDNSDIGVVMAGVDALQQELEEGLANLRFLIADLEPGTVLGNFGLVAGLRRYLEKFQTHTHLSTELQVETLVEPLPYIIETAIFRVIQEVLYNVTQHANASSVHVTVAEKDGNLQFSVRDDGIGMSANLTNHPRRQLGLVSITEIANLLHGTIQINSKEARWTEVIFSIPYPRF